MSSLHFVCRLTCVFSPADFFGCSAILVNTINSATAFLIDSGDFSFIFFHAFSKNPNNLGDFSLCSFPISSISEATPHARYNYRKVSYTRADLLYGRLQDEFTDVSTSLPLSVVPYTMLSDYRLRFGIPSLHVQSLLRLCVSK